MPRNDYGVGHLHNHPEHSATDLIARTTPPLVIVPDPLPSITHPWLEEALCTQSMSPTVLQLVENSERPEKSERLRAITAAH
jgi:hypothetical protein